jgi:SAM-dependent methyltransferase
MSERPGLGAAAADRSRRYRARLYRYYTGHDVPPATTAGFIARAPSLRELVERHFPADRAARILDLGCGHGALLHFARQEGFVHLAGIDVSAPQVAAARALGISGVREGDLLEELRAAQEESVDVVVALDVLEHFTRDELLDLVDGVLRVLRPGGRFLIRVPNGESPLHGRILFGDATHESAFTHRSISHLLLASGFSRVECFEDAPKVHGPKSAVRALLWRAIRASLRLYLAAETGETGAGAIFTQNLLAVAYRPDGSAPAGSKRTKTAPLAGSR